MSKNQSACFDAAHQFAICVETKTPCISEGKTIKECIQRGEIAGCEALKTAYFECRRSQLDMRARIKGRKFQDSS